MNGLAIPLFWSALQVTFLALAGLVLASLLARRTAGTGAFLTTVTLVVCCMLTALSFSPVPDWWTWSANEPALAATPASSAPRIEACAVPVREVEEAAAPVEELRPARPTGFDLRRLWRHGQSAAFFEPRRARRWPVLVAAVFLSGTTWGLVRLVLGLWALRRLVRRSRRITERSLIDLAEQLRADMGGTPPLELRECAELTSAATVGWRRPFILLPLDWTTWDETERRAVLAHEFAHVRRRDFLAWLMARVSLTLHFYHPLVHLLVRRLHLQQELAADALGVRFGGGTGSYLRVLARMALRQDERPFAGPALTFISSPGTLLRRISMLKARDGVPQVAAPRGIRALGWALLALAAFGASALRSPAQKQDQPAPVPVTKTAAPNEAKNEPVPPFDLSYLAPDAQGVSAVRPSVIFGRSDMKKYRDKVNDLVEKGFAALTKDAGPLDLKIEDIEQLVISIQFVTRKDSKPGTDGQTQMLTHMPMVRTVRDHDWKKTLSALVPDLKEVKVEGHTCFLASKNALPLLGADVCFCVPDRRTLLMDSEDALRKMFQARKEKRAAPAWTADWKQVERCVFAQCVLDIRPMMAERKPSPEDTELPTVLLRAARSFVVGIDLDEELQCQFVARADTDKDAETIVQSVRELLKMVRTA